MYLAAFFAFLGMICIFLAFWPSFYKTWKTKDTKFLPIKLFSLFLLAGVLMSAGSIAGICKKPVWDGFYTRGWIFVILNVFVMSTNLYTVGLWCKNKLKERMGGAGSAGDFVEEEQQIDDSAFQSQEEFQSEDEFQNSADFINPEVLVEAVA